MPRFQSRVAVEESAEELAIRVLFEADAKRGKTAKSNAKVVEIPAHHHPVVLEPPKATRKEFPFEGFIDFQGIKIDVENAKGSTRSGTGPEGDWSIDMYAHYGEIRGTEGTDGDKLDVYVGDNHDSSLVVVIHQHNPWDGQYDEDKVVLGCDSIEEAIGLYKNQYDRPGFYREGQHTAMPIGTFWRWVNEERNKGKRVKMARKAALTWKAAPRLDLATVTVALMVKWVRITSSGQMGETVARRMPNGWAVQYLRSGQQFDPKALIKGRPKKDADIVALFAEQGGSAPHIILGTPPAVSAPARAPLPPAAPTLSTGDVTRYLKSMSTKTGGRSRGVDFDPPGSWSVEPVNRQRLDHYVGSGYRPGEEEDDLEGWDSEGWEEDYAGPLRGEVLRKLEAEFGKGVFYVDIGEKGHIDVQLTATGKGLMGKLAGLRAAGTIKITMGEVAARLKKEPFRNDRHDQSYDTRRAAFYSLFIHQRRHNGDKHEEFLVVWYTGNPAHRWSSKTVPTLKDAVTLANQVKPESDRITAEELGESPEGKLARRKQADLIVDESAAMGTLLAFMRGLAWNYITSHWQVAGDSFYGDHLLFERLYKQADGEADGLAEKLVALYGKDAVDGHTQAQVMARTLGVVADMGCPFERGLYLEQMFQVAIKETLKALEATDHLGIGMDDLLRTMANAHDGNIYLLQQRLGGKTASARRPLDAARKLAVRFALRQAAATASEPHPGGRLDGSSVIGASLR